MSVGLVPLKVTSLKRSPEKLTRTQHLLEGRALTVVLSLLLYTKEQFYYLSVLARRNVLFAMIH